MILTVTDFGVTGPYLGQMRAALSMAAPTAPIIDLMTDAPQFQPRWTAYLLPAILQHTAPAWRVVLAIIDPGVGSDRYPLMLRADGFWYVGPDNGLLSVVARRASQADLWQIDWRPSYVSRSFHGRDLFAPVAAELWRGRMPAGTPLPLGQMVGWNWPDDLAEIIYCDGYGNAMTGLRASAIEASATLQVGAHAFSGAGTFADVPVGTGFWYENSSGLVEIACRNGSAQHRFGLQPGMAVTLT